MTQWHKYPDREDLEKVPLAHVMTSGTFYRSGIYEGGFCESLNTFISLKPLGIGHANIPHIKAMDVPFHLIYSSLICAKRSQSDRQNKMGYLQTPGVIAHNNNLVNYVPFHGRIVHPLSLSI